LEDPDIPDVPLAFVKLIVKLYAVFFTNVPVPVDGEEVPDDEIEIEGLDVIVTPVIALPPVAAVQGTETVVEFVTETVPIVGV
jgi:hypothetical protein